MIKVLIIDDSALIGKILTEELSKYKDIEVIGTAMDPYTARDKIVRLQPDVVTLDLEMPRMDGLSFISKLMKYHPVPVIVVSSATPENSQIALKALQLGAYDIINLPDIHFQVTDTGRQLIHAIQAAVLVDINKQKTIIRSILNKPVMVNMDEIQLNNLDKVIVLGAAIGGTQIIEGILRCLPSNIPGMVIVQNIPEGFTEIFACRLNNISKIEVKEAKDNDIVIPGQALIAPGNKHIILLKNEANYYVKLKDGPQVYNKKPSVDILFQSVAKCAGKNALGIILTGDGKDGARGLLEMHKNGAYTIAQDQESSMLFEMPKEAINSGAVDEIVSFDDFPFAIINALKKKNVANN